MPTRSNASNFSPTCAPWEFRADQSFRKDLRLKLRMFLAANATADLSDSSAVNAAVISSGRDTTSCSAVSFAPSKRSVNSKSALSPPDFTASTMARARCSIAASNRLDGAVICAIRCAKSLSVWRMAFMRAEIRAMRTKSQNVAAGDNLYLENLWVFG